MNKPHLEYEQQLSGTIVGIDEVGCGPLAGPVFTAAVIIDQNYIINDINDSKKLSQIKRLTLYNKIISRYQYAIGSASVNEIDQYNILNATKLAMKRAIENLNANPDHILIDGQHQPNIVTPVTCIIGGDSKSLSIAAASIVAKVTRDRMMEELHQDFPCYNWSKNKGYGTKEHILAIRKHGFTTHHRKTFSPIKELGIIRPT